MRSRSRKIIHSQTHQALRSISARMRLGLTGTPIENRLRELKSLFDLVLPGYLPGDAVFREIFINPIEKNQDSEKKALLVPPHQALHFAPQKKRSADRSAGKDRGDFLLRSFAGAAGDVSDGGLADARHGLPRSGGQDEDRVRISMFFRPYRRSSRSATIRRFIWAMSKITRRMRRANGIFLSSCSMRRMGSGQKVVVFSQYLDMLAIIEALSEEKGNRFCHNQGLDARPQRTAPPFSRRSRLRGLCGIASCRRHRH